MPVTAPNKRKRFLPESGSLPFSTQLDYQYYFPITVLGFPDLQALKIIIVVSQSGSIIVSAPYNNNL